MTGVSNLLYAIAMRLDAYLVDLLYNILIKQRTLQCLYLIIIIIIILFKHLISLHSKFRGVYK